MVLTKICCPPCGEIKVHDKTLGGLCIPLSGYVWEYRRNLVSNFPDPGNKLILSCSGRQGNISKKSFNIQAESFLAAE